MACSGLSVRNAIERSRRGQRRLDELEALEEGDVDIFAAY
jgi:hypothetical protein